MISTMRPPYTGWNSSLVIPEYRYLANKILFATEFGWAGQSITVNNGTTGPLDLISGKRVDDVGGQYSQNSYGLSNFGTHFNFGDTFNNGFRWTDSQNLAWWVDSRTDIPVTIEGLVYLDTSIIDAAGNSIIIMGDNLSTGRLQLQLLYNTDHWELYVTRRTTASYQQARMSDALPTDRWVHVVATMPPFGVAVPELYIDSKIPNYSSQFVGNGTSGANTDSSITISQPSTSSEFSGKMAYIRVYQGVLTQDDVNKLYKDPFGPLRQTRMLTESVYPLRYGGWSR